ncbi:hypothetical protein EWH08_05720 [Sphingobium indicum]|uniref:Pilus assembly protein PilZ n=2 Tax=Sphingobium indicum TaxID=332055 RepID=A0A1L5BN88_SPHIB|nr:hypothetical protein [Sphingobium indicum]APL94237.1 hypothetical protein SIDU_06790 [Sphingobium indicum B90A]KEY97926.1 hypothetical protein AI27_15345 [Sphingomonas sp. BHC-A]NYI21217.1 hypothetical protein [Sphingobium indicum]RYM03979.1 hypothetical protein EWH08_05720 [Sphingobium indicum]
MSVSDSDFASNRQYDRQRRLLKALMRHADYGEIDILVRDVSEMGLGGRCDLDLAVGERVVILLPDCRPAPGKIAWRKGQSFGVQLEAQINPEAVRSRAPADRPADGYQVPEAFRPSGETKRPGFRTRVQGPDTNNKWR